LCLLFDITNKTVVITGASQGIGKEIAFFLAKKGANIALIARNSGKLENIVNELRSAGHESIAISQDLKKVSELNKTMKKIYDFFGSIDILINNAGVNIAKPAERITENDWDNVIDINLKSAFFCCQAAGDYLKKSNNGKIITMSSQMAKVGYYDRVAYCSSKGGVTQLTKSLAVEWAREKINVNAIAPTFIKTPMTESMFEDKEFKRNVLNKIPLGRLATIQDLLGTVLFLSSHSSDMITGQTIYVDGGWTIW